MLGSIIGSAIGGITSLFGQNQQMAAQKEFAKKGIQWRAEDARKAGIHPLAALGAQTAQYSPVGDTAGAHLGDAVGGAIDMASNRSTAQLQKAQVESAIEVNQAQAELLRAQSRTTIANARKVAIGGSPQTQVVSNPNVSTQATGKGGSDKANTLSIFGYDFPLNPGTSSAGHVSDLRGEPMEWIWPFIAAPGDLTHIMREGMKRNPTAKEVPWTWIPRISYSKKRKKKRSQSGGAW